MAEAGGPSTQSGIFYQNSLAARRLMDLLSLEIAAPRDRVVEVRVESPVHVDDIVVRYADGHREWIQVKENISSSGTGWKNVWASFQNQMHAPSFGPEDFLVLAIGTRSPLVKNLRQLCASSSTSIDEYELVNRLNVGQRKVLEQIANVVSGTENAVEILRRTRVEATLLSEIEEEVKILRLGSAFAIPGKLYSILRDIAASESRNRMTFLAAPLRRRLLRDWSVNLSEPAEWGLGAYRQAVKALSVIEIPGTNISAPVDEIFVWPLAYNFERGSTRDFEDELPRWQVERTADSIDPKHFSEEALLQCVIVAGPGYGKSALLQAIRAHLISTPIVPVILPLGAFGSSNLGVLEYITNEINRDFSIRVDWHRLAEQGLMAILFDGLDEIPLDQRTSVLARIRMLSARHPLLPWILTIRDPSVVNGPANAPLYELLPLDNAEIAKFIESIKKQIPELDIAAVMSTLNAHPDLARLARIPLFLSMMLSRWKAGSFAPHSRSDLIEMYLQTLFSPGEHKSTQNQKKDSDTLRLVAEALAFESVDRHEIGTTSKQVLLLASAQATSAPQEVLEGLLTGGVLRRQNAVRLQFPYPIVQEYLAACYLVRTAREAISSRTSDAVKRPWAQVIQFSIELLPEATQVINQMLNRPDDAFSTGLRLIARCIVNGAKVDVDVREKVGSRLASVWVSSSHRTRERVGQLIADGFASPLTSEVRRCLGMPHLLNSGAGLIITSENSSELTLEVLEKLLDESKDDIFLSLHSLKKAFSRIGDRVIERIEARIERENLEFSQLESLEQFLSLLDHTQLRKGAGLKIASQDFLPLSLRLAAFSINPGEIDEQAWFLVEQSFQSHASRYRERWAMCRLLSRVENSHDRVISYLIREDIPIEYRVDLISSISGVIREEGKRLKFFKIVSTCAEVPRLIQDLTKVYLARNGDRSAFEDLLSRLITLPEKLVLATLYSLNYWPETELGRRAISASEMLCEYGFPRTRLAQAAFLGVRYKFEKEHIDSGQLHDSSLHPSSSEWSVLINSWSQTIRSPIERLKLLLVAFRLGQSEALREIETIVNGIEDPDDMAYDNDENGMTLRDAMDEIRRKGTTINFDLAEKFVRAKRLNLSYAGVAAIAAEPSDAALNKLLELHNDASLSKSRSDISDAVERLAARLGVTIVKRDNLLFRES